MIRHLKKRAVKPRMDDDFTDDLDNDPQAAGPGSDQGNSDDVTTVDVDTDATTDADVDVLVDGDEGTDDGSDEDDIAEAEAAVEAMAELSALMASAKSAGFASKGLVSYARERGLLEGTALQTGALEAFGDDKGTASVEAFAGQARAKIKQLAAKASEKTSAAFAKVGARLSALTSRIRAARDGLRSGISETAKAIPYKEAAVIVGSMVAAAALGAALAVAVRSGKPSLPAIAGPASKVQWPAHLVIDAKAEKLEYRWLDEVPASTEVAVIEGGWNAQKASGILDAILKSVGGIMSAIKELAAARFRSRKAATEARVPNDASGMAAHYFMLFAQRLIMQVVKKVIIGGTRKLMKSVLRMARKKKAVAEA